MTTPLRTFPTFNNFNHLTPRNVRNVRNVRMDVRGRRSGADADKSHVMALSVRNACPHPRLAKLRREPMTRPRLFDFSDQPAVVVPRREPQGVSWLF